VEQKIRPPEKGCSVVRVERLKKTENWRDGLVVLTRCSGSGRFRGRRTGQRRFRVGPLVVITSVEACDVTGVRR
jgi:hypothetical protein